MPKPVLPPPNNTFVRTAVIEAGNAFNLLQAPLDLSTAYDTGHLVVSSQFLIVPIVLLVAGIIAFLTLLLVRVLSWLCCCECRQKVIPTTQVEIIKDAIHNYQNCCTATFYTVCVYMVLVVHLIVWRRQDLLDSAASSLDFADFIQTQATTLQTASNTLGSSIALMVSDVKGSPASCIGKNLTTAVLNLQSEASGFSTTTKALVDVTKGFHSTLDSLLGNNMTVELSVWILYSVPLLCALVLGYNHWHRSQLGVKIFLAAGGGLYLGLLAASFVFLSITMILANVCMTPVAGFVQVAPTQLRSTLTYYSSCYGVNPLYNHTAFARQQIDAIDVAYNHSCLLTNSVAAFPAHKKAARLALLGAENAVNCPRIRKKVVGFIQDSVCTGIFNYSSNTWFALQTSCFFLYCLFVIGLTVYRFPSEEAIDFHVEKNFNADNVPDFETYINTGRLSPRGGRISSKVSDFGGGGSDETKSDWGRSAARTEDI